MKIIYAPREAHLASFGIKGGSLLGGGFFSCILNHLPLITPDKNPPALSAHPPLIPKEGFCSLRLHKNLVPLRAQRIFAHFVKGAAAGEA